MRLKSALLFLGVAAALSFGSGAAKADTVTYDFTGAGTFAGEDFTYVSTTGFLSLSGTLYTPTTETGGVASFQFAPFIPGHEIVGIEDGGVLTEVPVTGLNPGIATTENLGGVGTLVITDIATPTVPEIDPGNAMAPLALLAGVIFIIRGRRDRSGASSV